ncbi:MAG: c-type cytochrome [Campylobacteraceae bacterium]|jgi:ubiquinol-cytochrome c reductase cytochrome c1 subunit|nr:c-type cytochrome [Campylobacteraceae bacterium]
MKELKILAVLVVFTLLTYIGIEPFAHKEMNPAVAPANFNYEQEDIDLASVRVEEAKIALKKAEDKLAQNTSDQNLINAVESAKKDIELRENDLSAYKELWAQVNKIEALKGDADSGAGAVELCLACHSLNSQDRPNALTDEELSQNYGVVLPDLSLAGAIYDKKFLAALIINPAQALKITKKFNDENPFLMSATPVSYDGEFDEASAQSVADIIAYLQSIAPQNATDKEVFESACVRCHDMRYDAVYSPSEKTALKAYMGSNPPDLSMMIRSRLADYLENFINDPQKKLDGTAMPRVGLTKEHTEQVIAYMDKVGDSKKEERVVVGIGMIIFFAILALLAYLWKVGVWRDLH